MKLAARSLRALLALCIPVAAFAAPKMPANNAFPVESPGGKHLSCYEMKNGSFVSGKIKGPNFVPASKELQKLKYKAQNAANKTQEKKAKSKLKTRKAEVKSENDLCKNGGGGPQGTSSLEPLDRTLTQEDIRYLLEKAGFGLGNQEQELVSIGLNQGLEALVTAFMQTKTEDPALMPRVIDRFDNQIGSTTTQSPSGQRAGLVDLWTHTKNPYAEKFALFLLNIWTLAGDAISDETFRHEWWTYYSGVLRTAAYSDTNLTELALNATKNGLMLVYLNNELNVKGNPNENYAREVMELFLLGTTDLDGNPNYTETQPDGSGDIAVAAKMLTGFKVERNYSVNNFVVKEESARHEPGPHQMFVGKPYAFSGEDYEDLIKGIISKHPNVKYYYAEEILKEYVTPVPPAQLIVNFGNVIASNGYNLRPAMASLFKSKAFFDSAYRNTVPKNAAEYLAEYVRTLGLADALNFSEAEKRIADIGMQINQPPSVFWYPQSTWISPSAMLESANMVALLFSDTTALALPEPDWSISSVLPSGSVADTEVLSYVAGKLGVSVAANEASALQNYMNTEKQWNGVISSNPYDNTNSNDQRRAGRGLYYILANTSDFHLK